MVERREWRWVAWVALAALAASWLPYLSGWVGAPPGSHFTGLVYNPLDGHTYVAKMRLGSEGSWLFRLTYTPEPQRGAPIYLFYLLLGHAARWTALPLLVVYHGMRTAGGLALLFGLYRLSAHLAERVGQRRALFLLAAFGAGVGWLAGPLGRETPDLWVAEAFPFAALLTNAHFPVALALMVWTAHWGLSAERQRGARAGLALGAVALGAIQPFGLLPLLAGLAGASLARGLRQRAVPWRSLAWTGLAAALSLPYPLCTLWVLRSDPILAAWQAQNVTPSPSLLDWLLGLGLPGLLAAAGTAVAVRRGGDADGLLVAWVVVTAAGLALPLNLARRLSLGLGLAVGMLAGLGWQWVAGRLRASVRRLLVTALAVVSGLTPLFLLVLGAAGALGHHALLYLTDGEWAALVWLRDRAPHDAVVLSAPETGVFVPAWAGQRVVYGHPTETAHAGQRRMEVERFWAGERDPAWLGALGVEYLFYGPRERALGPAPEGEPLFTTEDTSVYHR